MGFNRINFSGLDLSGRDFSGENLTGADFRLSRLNGIQFAGAELSGARFFLSSGLTKEQQRDLKTRGAKAWFFFTPTKIALLLVIPLILAVLLYHTATAIDFISIPSLKEKTKLAIAHKNYQQALKYNQELLERSGQYSTFNVYFKTSLEAAKIYTELDRHEEALAQLLDVYADSRLNLEQKARINNDLARFFLAQGEQDTALGYIKEIDRNELSREALYMLEMSRALILSRQKDFSGALTVYRSLLQIVINNPAQVKRIKARIKSIENKTK